MKKVSHFVDAMRVCASLLGSTNVADLIALEFVTQLHLVANGLHAMQVKQCESTKAYL